MARTRSNNNKQQTPKKNIRKGRKNKSPLIKNRKSVDNSGGVRPRMVRKQRKEYNPDLVSRIKQNLAKWKQDDLLKSVLCLLGDTSLTYNIEDIQQDLNLFQDLDLAVFGAPSETYQEYIDQLQKEYSHMDINSYKKMRLKEQNLDKNQQSNIASTSRMTTPKSRLKVVNNRNSSINKNSQKKKGKNKQTPKKSLTLSPLTPIIRVVTTQTSDKSTVVSTHNNNVDSLNDEEIIPTNDLTIEENDSDIEIIEENVTVINLIEENSQDVSTKVSPKNNVTSITKTTTATADSNLINENIDKISNEQIELPIIDINEKMQSNTPVGDGDGDVEIEKNLKNSSSQATKDFPNESIVTVDVTEASTNQQLFFNDTIGGNNSLKVPLYDPISDTSFMFDDTAVTSTPNNTVIFNKKRPVNKASLTPATVVISSKRSKSKRLDDSVVFVSETVLPSRNDFIPIAGKRCRNQVKSITPPNKKKKPNRTLQHNNKNIIRNQPIQSSSQSYVAAATAPPPPPPITYACNLYNPNKNTEHTNPKRMIIIDGNNVAFGHSCNNEFSVRGIVICIEFFEREGHIVKAVLPQMRLKQKMSSDSALLETLQKQGKILLTPCKNLPGQRSVSYDDRFIMDLAVELDAAVISNDNYKDLLDIPKYRNVILARVVGYTWCNDMIMLPQDPYGRNGPSLSQILNRNIN